MRTLLLFTLLYTNTLFANSFEVEAVHLKNGEIVSVQDESYSSLDEVRAIEIVNENNTRSLVSPRIFNMLLNGGNDPVDKIGGDGSGGSPMMKMSTRGAVRVGGDGSGGG